MIELEDAEWTLRIARLIEIIATDNNAIKRHTEGNSPQMIMEQYEELRAEHLGELSELLKGSGMTIQLLPMTQAA